ncbi:hypothetical protein EVG20_g10263 [Dentipellis fragilis]|uniref:Uncharacterized protein n=1 Tax=Dentipellis fragilis TaxID=205917 RepID=A0A4Y9XSK6_9AGAM|nr:hypothetical protein EVG20_g10263 [Dentipellis fragilis]
MEERRRLRLAAWIRPFAARACGHADIAAELPQIGSPLLYQRSCSLVHATVTTAQGLHARVDVPLTSLHLPRPSKGTSLHINTDIAEDSEAPAPLATEHELRNMQVRL